MSSRRKMSTPPSLTYINDNEYSIQLARWFLKPIGAWPRLASTSHSDTMLSIFLIILCLSLILAALIPCIMYMLLEERVPRLQIRAFGPMSFWLMAMVKYGLLFLHVNDIKSCLQHIEIDWKRVRSLEDREIMLKNAKVGRYIAGSCVACMHIGLFCYDIVRWFVTITVVIGNESIPTTMLPLPAHSGVTGPQDGLGYKLFFGLQCISSFIVNSVTAGACGLATVFVMHACGQLDIVISWLNKLVEKGEEFRQRETDIVENHTRVLRSYRGCYQPDMSCRTSHLYDRYMYSWILFSYGITDHLEIELHETANIIAYPIIFIAIMFNIFIYCYIGEILAEQCRQVGEAAYMTQWYQLPDKNALDFIFIITRSRSVINLTAGKMVYLSISTFGSVVKTSAAYVNLLRQVT